MMVYGSLLVSSICCTCQMTAPPGFCNFHHVLRIDRLWNCLVVGYPQRHWEYKRPPHACKVDPRKDSVGLHLGHRNRDN